jgi:hypothetical protein
VGFPIIGLGSIVALLLGMMLLGLRLVSYSNQGGQNLQADVVVAGVQVGGLSESEAQSTWERVYLDQPITLIYKNSPITLSPRSLGFSTNNEAMLAQVRAQSAAETNFWEGFWAYLWQQPAQPIQVALDSDLQEGQLRSVLQDIAARYDTEAGAIGFDLASLTFQSGAAGSRLDVDGSVQLIAQTLQNPDPTQRTIELPTSGVTSGAANMDDLRQAIITYLESQGFLYDGVTSIGSVYVQNLDSGEEMSILGDVAHSAVSTIKIGIMINYYRYQVTAPDLDTAYLLASAIICSHNPGANFLVQTTSDNRQNMIQGLQRVSETMLQIGAINSWLISPLFVGEDGEYPIVAVPERPNLPDQAHDAQADPLNQSTVEDMGTMLAMIYDCALYGGGLRAVYPNEITQDECVQMIEVLTGVKFWRFSELGAPDGTRIAHKVGYAEETVGDVAIVFSPNADYLFVTYLWEEDLDYNNITRIETWDMIDEVARIVYNYFNPQQPVSERRLPVNPLGGAACVLPLTTGEINLNDIDQNRFDAAGIPVSTACYDWPNCRPFDNWGQ